MSATGTAPHRETAEPLAAVARFVAGFTHRLQSPLTSLRGYGELADREEDRAQRAYWHQQLQGGIASLSQLLEGYRRYQLPDRTQPREIPATELVAEAWQVALRVTPGGSARRARLRCDLAESLVWNVDPFHFRNLLVNLFQNALDACPLDGLVRVGMGPGELLRIEDGGAGLQGLSAAELIEPFFTTRADRAGLGLAVANQIALAHGLSLAWRDLEAGGACARVLTDEHDEQQRSQG